MTVGLCSWDFLICFDLFNKLAGRTLWNTEDEKRRKKKEEGGGKEEEGEGEGEGEGRKTVHKIQMK